MNSNLKTLKVGDTVIVCERMTLSTYPHYPHELGTVTRVTKTQIDVNIGSKDKGTVEKYRISDGYPVGPVGSGQWVRYNYIRVPDGEDEITEIKNDIKKSDLIHKIHQWVHACNLDQVERIYKIMTENEKN